MKKIWDKRILWLTAGILVLVIAAVLLIRCDGPETEPQETLGDPVDVVETADPNVEILDPEDADHSAATGATAGQDTPGTSGNTGNAGNGVAQRPGSTGGDSQDNGTDGETPDESRPETETPGTSDPVEGTQDADTGFGEFF